MNLNEAVEVKHKPSVLALDGEQEIELGMENRIYIRLTRDGPWLIDIQGALKEAARNGFFTERALEEERGQRTVSCKEGSHGSCRERIKE